MPLTSMVGIPTFNRRDILIKCFQHISKQIRLPDEIIVADSSPDANETQEILRKEVPEIWKQCKINYIVAPKGISLQRNIVLDNLNTDILFYLDDDTLISPDYIEKIMEVYEADHKNRLGGIQGNSTEGRGKESGEKKARFRLPNPHQIIQWLRINYAGGFYPEEYYKPLPIPDGLEKFHLSPVRTLYGCVMSFRSIYAKQFRFNELFKFYSFLEDFDFSYKIGRNHPLVKCENAYALHVGSLGGRLDPSLIHYLYLINIAYIAKETLEPSENLFDHVKGHHRRFRHLEYLLGFARKSGFSQYNGVKAGEEEAAKILAAPSRQVDEVYTTALNKGIAATKF